MLRETFSDDVLSFGFACGYELATPNVVPDVKPNVIFMYGPDISLSYEDGTLNVNTCYVHLTALSNNTAAIEVAINLELVNKTLIDFSKYIDEKLRIMFDLIDLIRKTYEKNHSYYGTPHITIEDFINSKGVFCRTYGEGLVEYKINMNGTVNVIDTPFDMYRINNGSSVGEDKISIPMELFCMESIGGVILRNNMQAEQSTNKWYLERLEVRLSTNILFREDIFTRRYMNRQKKTQG